MSYNNNYTTHRIDKKNIMRNLIINDWVSYLESIKDHSSNTIKNYELDVINFLQFMKYRKNNLDISIDKISELDIKDIDESFVNTIDVRDLIAYINYTDKNLNNSSSTRSRKFSSLRSFYNYMYKVIAVIDENPMSLIDGPKIPKRLPHYLELEEVNKLLKSILENEDDFYRYRDFSIVMLFLNTGLRLSELVNIKLTDFNKNKNSIRIIGKGNKERVVYLNNAVLDTISDYLNIRPDSDLDYLYLNKKGDNFLGTRGVQYMLEKYLKKCGLGGKYSPHSLRHTAATLLYKYGDIDIRTLQVILGHESVSTTQIYTHVDEEQIAKAVELNPIKELDLKI